MNKNKKIGFVVLGVIVLVGAFYGGTVYGKSHAASSRAQAFLNGGNRMGRMGGAFGGGLTTGSILSKDAQSVTLTLPTGGSKIVFFTPQTTVTKTVDGTAADLAIGKNVVIMGTANADGSVSATSIQLRPAFTMPTTNPATQTAQ